MQFALTISVITMNRSKQLVEALQSCLDCRLPAATEFVIIDNASTDDTEQAVHRLLSSSGYSYYYEKLPENLGVGGGRNYAFSKSNGKYIYVLDDDAVIDTQKNPDFFTKAVELLDQNPKYITLTTQIYDEAWQANRMEKSGPEIAPGVFACKMFCGGSHFLRKDFFKDVPYLPNKYGYEEIPPALRVMDAACYNVFCPELLVIHKPAVNKWDWSEEKNQEILVKGIAAPYAIMKMMYPMICRPLLWAATQIRIYRSLRQVTDHRARCRHAVGDICTNYPIKDKIKIKTVFWMVKLFKLSAF